MTSGQNRPSSGQVESVRLAVIGKVRSLKMENEPRISDTAWVSQSGYNPGRWADKGFNIALDFLRETKPRPEESDADYLHRVIEMVRTRRDQYKGDAADEEGACCRALDASIQAMLEGLPREPLGGVWPDPAPKAEWQVFYQDLFDRETPRWIDATGRGLANGLVKLWARHLFETVRPDGGRGFSRFNLWWDQGSASIVGDSKGATRLRHWVFGLKTSTRTGYTAAGDVRLLDRLAVAHARLLLRGEDSQKILALATTAKDKYEFETQLRALAEL